MTLPEGWVKATFAEIANQRSGNGKLIKGKLESQPGAGLFPAYSASGQDVWRDAYEQEGDAIIVSAVGARCGKAFRARGKWSAIANTHVVEAESNAVDIDFLYLLLNDEDFWEKGGTAQPFVKVRATFERILNLPPLAEQRRIVAKLDALTARLARARAELDRVPVLAANLRATSVTDAFRGAATAEHRLQSNDQAADDEHLDRQYEAVAGRVRRKPAEPIDWQPDISIPSPWRWVSVDQVIARAQYGSSSKTRGDPGVPVLRMGNIRDGRIGFANLKYLPNDHAEFPELFLQPGDVIFNRTNSFELVGKSAVFYGADAPVSFASYLIRVQCFAIRPKLLAYYLNSAVGRQWVASVASQQVGQANVNGTKLRGLGIPLPPEGEQAAMEAWINNAFARADRMEAEAARARALIDRLEAAILGRAFRGELVPQDPNDEPASVLLDRIRAQRAAAPKPKRSRRKKAEASG